MSNLEPTSYKESGIDLALAQRFEQLSAERKQLQAQGIIPPWYTTQGWQLFKEKYQYQDEEAVLGRHHTIAKTLAQYMVGEEERWEKLFFDELWDGILSPATPALSNTGTDRGMNVSCSGQFVGDSVVSFYDGLKEMALLSKNGFGTSADFSSIRPRGAAITAGGEASGPVPVMEDFFTTASKISQGGNRRGAVAGYLDIEHPDWDEAIDLLNREPDGKNFGWTVRDSFVEALKVGDAEANRRFTRAMYTKLITGKGYFFFVDKANRHRPEMYKDLGLDIKATNLCVAPETLILTDKGYQVISEQVNKQVNVWNGSEWSEVTVRKTGTNQKLLKVTLDSGLVLECTPEHKFYVQDGYSPKTIREVRAKDLQKGNKLIKLETPVIRGEQKLNNAYANGFYTGDGCDVEGKSRIYLYGAKRKLLDRFPNRSQHYVQDKHDREYFYVDGLQPKFFVPNSSYTVKSRLNWLAGLLDADGCLTVNGSNQSLQVASTNKDFLVEVSLMLQTLGVQSKVRVLHEAGPRLMPDGRGGKAYYECATTYRLLISSNGLYALLGLGYKSYRMEFSHAKPQRNAEQFVKVTSVEDTGRVDDTYCFTEPKKHLGVFNGILTGQCTEIMLHSSEEYTYSCILASMNLVNWDVIKERNSVFIATVFLDCLCEDFIRNSEGVPGLEKVREFTIKGRAIGLGAMGFHTYLQGKRIAYESLEAQFLANEMAKHIQEESLRATKYLAERFGEPEWCKGYGVRNTHRVAYAPTKSTALLMGGVSESWSPDPGMVFDMFSTVGELRRIPPRFYELMIERGQYTEETIRSIINNVGSVQHLDWLTPEEKQVFRNAYEVDQFVILRHSVRRQQYTCQGQSLNFFVAEEGTEDIIANLMTEVFLNENILSQYYFYSKSGVVVPDECLSCSA